jgi:hypothetical protein
MMELFIIFGGAYALYTVGMAIATEIDYRAVNRRKYEDTWIPSLDRIYSRFMFCIPVWDIGSIPFQTNLPKII